MYRSHAAALMWHASADRTLRCGSACTCAARRQSQSRRRTGTPPHRPRGGRWSPAGGGADAGVDYLLIVRVLVPTRRRRGRCCWRACCVIPVTPATGRSMLNPCLSVSLRLCSLSLVFCLCVAALCLCSVSLQGRCFCQARLLEAWDCFAV